VKRDPLRDGFLLAAAVWVIAIAVGLVPGGVDARTFYDHLWQPYGGDYASLEGFYWPPPAALALRPFTLLGFQPFAALMTGAGLAAVAWIGGRWAFLLLFFPPVWWDVSAGNVNVVIGAASLAMVARPGWLAIPALTKVTPGLVVGWFLVRREWRQAAVALGFTAALCAVSLVLAPELWPAWIGTMLANEGYAGPGYFVIEWPLIPRLGVAAVLVAWGASQGHRWVLPVAAWLAIPVLWWSTAACLVAVLRDHHGRVLSADRIPSPAREGEQQSGGVVVGERPIEVG
jgi:hypothetical protein